MKSLKTQLFKGQVQTFSPAFLQALDEKFKEIDAQYNVSCMFAGLFGSRAKGYSGPKSDFDFYVPYVGSIYQCFKAIDVDTREIDGEPVIPAQVTFEINEGDKPHTVQLNFVPYSHFVSQLGNSNVDFRIALNHITIYKCSSDIIRLFFAFAQSSFDAEKVKFMCLGRAKKTARQIIEGDDLVPSEVLDSLYRLFLAARMTNPTNAIKSNRASMALTDLVDEYFDIYGHNGSLRDMMDLLRYEVSSGKWPENIGDWKQAIALTIEQTIPLIKERPFVSFYSTAHSEKSIHNRLQLVKLINDAQVNLVLERHLHRTISQTKVT